MSDPILNMIGLATKAGKTVSGEWSAEDSIKKYKAQLVINSTDASENTKKHFSDMCSYRDIPWCTYGTKEELGKFTGKKYRATVVITDSGFAKKIEAMIREV